MKIAETVFEALAAVATGFVPVQVDVEIAISVYQQVPCAYALYMIGFACTPSVTDSQRQLDFLSALPDRAWEEVRYCKSIERQPWLAISRSIAWRSVCA